MCRSITVMPSAACIVVAAAFFLAGAAPATKPSTRPAPSRREIRPILSDDQYQTLADELREAYSRPSDQWPKPNVDPGAKFTEIGLLPEMTFPKDNPYSKEKADLGKELFFDPRLSSSGAIACAS